MNLFGKPNYDIRMLQTTSKDALKRSALMMCGGDLKEAMAIYEFFIKDIENIPDFEPTPVPFMEQAKATVGDVFGFIDQNKDKIAVAVDFIKSMRGGGTGAPAQPLPQLR